MTAKKITARFHDGDVSRVTEAAYTHASRRDGTVRFHTSESAARTAAGRFGEVVRTDFVASVTDTPATTWRVSFTDGTTFDVATDVPPHAVSEARAAHPDKTVASATRV